MPEPLSSEPLPQVAEPQLPEKGRTQRPAARARVLPMRVAELSTAEKIRKQLQISANRAASAYRNLLRGIASWRQQGRTRARYLVDEYPLQVIGTVAVTAFALGILLRIRRTRHE
jgi:ElaB/YqjD/DUF883 family membrane-anchored ribosome-binding protein